MIAPLLPLALATLSGLTCADAGPDSPCVRVVASVWLVDVADNPTYESWDLVAVGPRGEVSAQRRYSAAVTRAVEGPGAGRVPPEAAHGRAALVCMAHDRPAVAILGGLPRDEFSLLAATEAFVAEAVPAPRPTAAGDLASRGLASRSSADQRAAQEALARLGAASVGPCLRGLASRDAEVRLRCGLILDELRNGERAK